MTSDVFEPVLQQVVDKGLVILAGAGVSMDEPASLPGWFALNGLIIDSLCQTYYRLILNG